MKNSFFLLLIILSISAHAQLKQNELLEFRKQKYKLNHRAMQVLTGWAAANLAVSGAGVLIGKPETEGRYFHTMNLAFNAVNLGIAIPGLLDRETFENKPAGDILKSSLATDKIFLYMSGLDVAYITGGLFVREMGTTRKNPEIYKGFGNSLIYNGAFLLLFDTGMYYLSNKKSSELLKKFNSVSISTSNGLGLRYQF